MKKAFLFLALILSLASCGGGSGPVRYTQPDTPGGRMCVMECRKAKDKCVEACAFKERECVIGKQSAAMKSYEAYAQERFKARQSVDLLPSSFEDTSGCKAQNCRAYCEQTYNDCFELCGGSVSGSSPDPWGEEAP